METKIAKRPVLITLTSPSAGGKSYLFNFIRDVAKLPCLISTTTRSPRAGEVEGQDYFFITEEESLRLEEQDQFAELAIYNGTRYGVTKTEFRNKMSQGMAFLICEPTGIDHYVRPASEMGALHYKTFIHTDPKIRLQRFRDRTQSDILRTIQNSLVQSVTTRMTDMIMKEVNTALNRQQLMLTDEMKWFGLHQWDRVLFGEQSPESNLQIILADVAKMQSNQWGVDTNYAHKQKASDAAMFEASRS